MSPKNIAWLVNQQSYVESYVDTLREKGIHTHHWRYGQEALDDFVRGRKYDAIITDLDIAPGPDYTDPIMGEVMNTMSFSYEYWQIGLRVIAATREEKSLNKNTPLVVASMYHPEKSVLFPNAEARCKEKGATK